MEQRENGYYWILCAEGDYPPEWEIAEWHDHLWSRCGSEWDVDADMPECHPCKVLEVGARIERPV